MLHPSTRKLIDRLAEMTELGKLDWTEGESGSLLYSTEGYSVCLPEGAQEVVIQSIDGKELERAGADALASTMTDSGTSYAQIVSDMGAEANRYARGTETAISSLLAGMSEPEAAAEQDPTDQADQGPEDPGDESAALASEGIANHELKPAVESEETTPEAQEVEGAAVVATIDEAEEVAKHDLTAAPEGDMPVHGDTEPQGSTEDPVVMSANAETANDASDTDDVDTESDVTEAVARLADEVNNRPDTVAADPVETSEVEDVDSEDEDETSTIGLAAATAMGAVASAAGLSEDAPADEGPVDTPTESDAAELETDDTLDVRTDDEIEVAATTSAYVPFGLETAEDSSAIAALEETSDDVTPTAFGMPSETSETIEPADEPAVPEDINADAETVTTFETTLNDTPTESMASEPEVEITAQADTPVEVSLDAPSDEAELEPEAQFVSTEGTSSFEAPLTETSTEDTPGLDEASTPENTEDAPQSDTVEDTSVDAEPDPVLAAPEAPQTYSLSGIGAGFGLGALSAKTEASGIPGPTSAPPAEPEKIVIDATEDVLPELEGNLDLEKMEAAVSEINFGNKDKADPAGDAAAEDESEGDILKPRTRFNPWD